MSNLRSEQKEVQDTIIPEDLNIGTAIVNAIYSPFNIEYPQDFQLLNDCRLYTEEIIDKLYEKDNKNGVKPLTYRRELNEKYLNVLKK